MRYETFVKGDIAVSKVMVDLQEKGYRVLLPFSEQSSYDLVAHDETNNKFFRIQVKMLGEKRTGLKNHSWDPFHEKSVKYIVNSFDYYAAYYPEKNIIIYPAFKFGGKNINITVPNTGRAFYWYEDFLKFTDEAVKKTLKDFGLKYKPKRDAEKDYLKRKVLHPSKEELEKLVWEKPTTVIAKQFGVSDNAISKWCKNLGIKKPSRGYWRKLECAKEKIIATTLTL